ncbi:MAG: NUDIX domain-containing protein [Spirochaetaceae bacterium]|jgi:ADP-ribose pyrophosphatase YjhB (NUDIX family)|nr:NUDIX domain-containing protein [Spirochaetaceae bacterium]
MFNYCPSCASANIRFEDARVFKCPDCGFVYYHNTAAATALLVDTGRGIIFVRRGKEPAAGKLDFPGGFVEPREGAVDGLIRECREEIGWAPERGALSLFASFPNVYPYKNIVYNTCDLFFSIRTGWPAEIIAEKLRPMQKEIAGIVLAGYEDIDLDEIAFDSVRAAVSLYLKKLN